MTAMYSTTLAKMAWFVYASWRLTGTLARQAGGRGCAPVRLEVILARGEQMPPGQCCHSVMFLASAN